MPRPIPACIRPIKTQVLLRTLLRSKARSEGPFLLDPNRSSSTHVVELATAQSLIDRHSLTELGSVLLSRQDRVSNIIIALAISKLGCYFFFLQLADNKKKGFRPTITLRITNMMLMSTMASERLRKKGLDRIKRLELSVATLRSGRYAEKDFCSCDCRSLPNIDNRRLVSTFGHF